MATKGRTGPLGPTSGRPESPAAAREGRRLGGAAGAVAIVAAGAVLRAALLARSYEPPELWGGDPSTYVEIMRGLLKGRLIPDAWIWPPGYPILALPFLPLGAGNALLAVSFLSGSATPALILWAGRRAGYFSVAAVAAGVVAFHPEAILSSVRALSGAPALFLSVATLIALEAALRTGRLRYGVLAGACAGLGLLTRPELLVSTVLFGAIAVLAGRARRQPVLALAGVALLVVAPYVIGLHAASGTWSMSLKPHVNILKGRIYERADTFPERRALWDTHYETFLDESGDLKPRELAAAVSPSKHLLRPGAAVSWSRNVAFAFRRGSPVVTVVWILGAAGFVLASAFRTRVGALAIASAAPFFAAAVVFPALGRYGLSTVPALAWGVGCLGQWLVEVAGGRSGSARRVSLALLAVLFVAGGTQAVRELQGSHWTGRHGEFDVEMRRNNLERAESLVEEGLRLDPRNPEVWAARGELRERRGDAKGALDAYERAARLGGDPVRLAAVLVRLGQPAKAEALVLPLRDSPPASAEYWGVEGNLAYGKKDWLRAAHSFRRAAELGGPRDLLALNIGVCLVRAGQRDEGEALIRAAAQSSDAQVRQQASAALREFSAD